MDEATKMNRRHAMNQMKLAAEVFHSLARQVGEPTFTDIADRALAWAGECEAVFKAGGDFMAEATRQEMEDVWQQK